jgi:subtilisin family serine protease
MRRLATILFASLFVALIVFTPCFTTTEVGRVAGGAGDFSVSNGSSPRWGLSAIKAREAWNVTTGSKEIVVAVIDSGIDRTIPALEKNAWENEDEIPNNGIDDDNNGYVDDVSGWDFREDDELEKSARGLHYHGTFVAGLVGSSYDKNTGAGGVAPDISIMDLRFLNEEGKFFTSDWDKLAGAIEYAVDNGADIINMSLYASIEPPELVQDAVERAEEQGVLVIGIAGNSGGEVGYFGRWKETFTIGSVNRSRRISYFSNRGPSVDLVAPGESVLSFKPGGEAVTGSGTSFAAPHVAGTAALILSQEPEMGLSELKEALRDSALDIARGGVDEKSGYGLIDSERALNAVSDPAGAEENPKNPAREDSAELNEDETGVTTFQGRVYYFSKSDLPESSNENPQDKKDEQGEFSFVD